MTSWNTGAERLKGYAAAEIIGSHFSRFYIEVDRAADLPSRALAIAAREGRYESEGWRLRQDGRRFWAHVIIDAVHDPAGAVIGYAKVTRDLTERRAAEEAERRRERQVRILGEGVVAAALDAIITIDRNDRIILFNPAAAHIFAVPAAKALGEDVFTYVPSLREAARVAGEGAQGDLVTAAGLRGGQEPFPIEASISRATIDGESYTTFIVRDVTARAQADEARELLAREVDHRAKNVLAVVSALVTLTKAPSQEQYAQAIRGRVQALARAHDILARASWTGADLAGLILEEANAFGRADQVHVTGPAVTLAANAVQPVGLILHELATNAIKYGALSQESGRVEVEIGPGSGPDPGRALRLSWREHGGPPVAPPASPGFGSTLIREVVTRQLGGALDVRWPVEGLWMIAELPDACTPRPATGALAARPEAGPVERPRGRDRALLVVEDEALVGIAMAGGFREAGWTVVGPAPTVREALRLIEDHPHIDAAVLDINLQGEVVYPVAERLRELGVPFVFCSGYGEHVHAAFRAYPIVGKPCDTDTLRRHLARVG